MVKIKKYSIVFLVVGACAAMGFVDAVIKPGYGVKSIIKIALFLIVPFAYTLFDKKCNIKRLVIPRKGGIKIALLAGAGIYLIIVAAYLLLKNVFDFSSVTAALNTGVGVTKANFVWVALYISFANSLLEEFFFRGFSFLCLKEVSSRRFAYIFSAVMFALYHIAMMIGWFGWEVVLTALIGLAAGAVIFNYCNEKSGNIYISWLLHMFANFAINTVGFMLFEII